MKVDLSMKEKAKLCLVEHQLSIPLVQFDYSSFYDTVIFPNEKKVDVYAEVLFEYGCMKHTLYKEAISSETRAKDEVKDVKYLRWKTLCEQLIVLIERSESNNHRIYSTDGEGRNRTKIVDSTGVICSIEQLIILHLKQDLCNFQNTHKSAEQSETLLEDIDLGYLKDLLELSRQKEEYEIGISKGREMDISMLISHMCIQELSFLLRIDSLINQGQDKTSLHTIKLTNDDFRFIYNFLDFFDLVFYIPTINSNTPENIIKDRFKHFSKANVPEKIRQIYKARVSDIEKLAFFNR